MPVDVAYISQGKLFVKRGARPAQLIESRFGQEMIDRETRARQKNQWKSKSAGWNVRADGGMGFMGMGGEPGADPEARRIHITAVARGHAAGEMLYALDTDTVGGLFHYTLEGDDERRLIHHHEFRVRDLHRHPTDPIVACSVRHDDGSANIAVMPADGGKLKPITEGDSVDESPAWVPGGGQRLVYQSAGVGRNQFGQPFGLGPYRIEMLDLGSGRLDTLLEDPAHDLLLPRMTEGGDLYFIRRPYYLNGKPPTNPLRAIGDVLLVPVRVLQTLGAYLNFKSMIYRGKPLSSAGGPKREGPDMRSMLLWGRFIDAKQAEKMLRSESTGSLVGRDWQLIRRDSRGGEHVVASGVLSYDLGPDGAVIHTNGGGVYQLHADGRSEKLCDDRMVERVVALG